ncbi:hypothetical protein SAMN05216337_107138 [Bradyrhizobium brasilense]|uniref:Uncharacterized protein n=1 Tax=Bradyrhizobium brasilense TaxID=1419277 RepID=A0A1G7NQ17_9BRAD|nr:hypothetical protein SAMN05216337_107138 [Bradyrhizobium brasilense]
MADRYAWITIACLISIAFTVAAVIALVVL